jgi:hypothetical protein
VIESKYLVLSCGLALAAILPARAADDLKQTMWKFDNLDSIGGFKTEVEGHPKVIPTADGGKAIEFNGVDDAIWVEHHPLAGAKAFTIEAIFRPDGGDQSQRWFHIASIDPKTGQAALPTGTADPNPRFTFELRVSNHDQWYLDSFTHGCATVPDVCDARAGYNSALMEPNAKHPIGHWYAVAQTYDGKTYRSYVNGVLQKEAAIDFKPQGPGRTAIGTRMNRLNYFRGAVMMTRFTPSALPPDQLLKVPAALDAPDPLPQPRPPGAGPGGRAQ